jgi:uncharacterized protein YpmB
MGNKLLYFGVSIAILFLVVIGSMSIVFAGNMTQTAAEISESKQADNIIWAKILLTGQHTS